MTSRKFHINSHTIENITFALLLHLAALHPPLHFDLRSVDLLKRSGFDLSIGIVQLFINFMTVFYARWRI